MIALSRMLVVALLAVIGWAAPAKADEGVGQLWGVWEPRTVGVYTPRVVGPNWKLDQAIAAWNSIGVVTLVRVNTRAEANIFVRTAHPDKMDGYLGLAFPYASEGLMGSCPILLNRVVPRYYKGYIMAHEMGHCMGLPDNYSNAVTVDSIMSYDNPQRPEYPTAYDVATVQYAYSLPTPDGLPSQEVYPAEPTPVP